MSYTSLKNEINYGNSASPLSRVALKYSESWRQKVRAPWCVFTVCWWGLFFFFLINSVVKFTFYEALAVHYLVDIKRSSWKICPWFWLCLRLWVSLWKLEGRAVQGKLTNRAITIWAGFMGLHQNTGGAFLWDALMRDTRCPWWAFHHPQKHWSFFSPESTAESSCPNIGNGSAVNEDFQSQRYQTESLMSKEVSTGLFLGWKEAAVLHEVRKARILSQLWILS